jgi:hypothetical protein
MTSNRSCEKCDYTCCKLSNWDKHIKTRKHLGNQKSSQIVAECKICDYTCCKQSQLIRHKMTNKHITREKNITTGDMKCDPTPIIESSSQTEPNQKGPNLLPTDYMTIITKLLNQNSELKDFIIDQASEHKKETAEIMNKVIEQANKVIENVKPTCNISNTTNNNNNKAFNINMYLNEQCKDAMNFSDFINGIEVTHEDLENNAQLGFVGGISKILIDNLRLMNKNERPIHCTDAKRETMYIKDDNKWTKEEDDSKLRSAIQEITRKSICTLMSWKRGNPESDDMDSKFSGRCIVIQQQSMAGYNREVYYPKVIHAIAREVLVSK